MEKAGSSHQAKLFQSIERKEELESQIALQNVIQSELGQVKRTAKVYHKQQNSDIFFLSTVEHEMQKSKRTLDSLQEEYKALEQQESEANNTSQQDKGS